jgi:hypothetical protein
MLDQFQTQAALSAKYLEDVYLFQMNQNRLVMQAALDDVIRTTGNVLRVDHTYKVVSNMSAYSGELDCRVTGTLIRFDSRIHFNFLLRIKLKLPCVQFLMNLGTLSRQK